MNERNASFAALAELFEYPVTDFKARLDRALQRCQSLEGNEASEYVQRFFEETEEFSLNDMEELYTRTFDINPVASLEIGWHLYGEQYERGAFLVDLRKRLRLFEINEGTELPDHLTSVLRLMAAVEEGEKQAFVSRFLFKAVAAIDKAFVDSRNPYRHLVHALQSLMGDMVQQKEGVVEHV